MNPTNAIVIRRAHPGEEGVLRLAGLDSARVPETPLLLAEVDGQPRAALSLSDGSAIADPFHPSAELIDLLRMRAQAGRTPRRAGLLSLRRRLRPAY
jgi:hypothetical protein